MSALSLSDIQVPLPLKAHRVPVPEFGEGMTAHVAELSSDERDARIDVGWEEHKKARGNKSQAGIRAWVAAACWCDESRAFVCKDLHEISLACEQLGQHFAVPVTRMFSKAQEVNGIGTEQIEALEKN